jgi:hypothetical protein
MNVSTADLRNYWTEFHETWWSYRYMFLVGPTVFSFVVKGVKSHKFRYSKGVGFTIESYGKVEISYIFKMATKIRGVMKFCPVVPEICRGHVHVAKKERRRIIITRYNRQ